MNELIPKWRQQIQNDSIAVTFQPIHRICLEKIGHTKASLTSQDFSMEISEKNGETDLIHHTSSIIAMDISSMPLLPYLCNPATCTAEGAGGKHAMCVIPIGFTLQQWCAVSSHRKGWMWWMRWKGFSDERLWLDGWDGCDLCDLCCDELVISVVSLGTGSSSIVGQKAPTQPAASSGWDAEAALGLPRNRVWTDGSRPNLCDRQSLGMSSQERRYQGRPYSTSSMRWTFEKYRWSRWRWEHKPVLQDTSLHGPLQTLKFKKKNTSKNTSMNVHVWVVSLLFESFRILSESVSSLENLQS